MKARTDSPPQAPPVGELALAELRAIRRALEGGHAGPAIGALERRVVITTVENPVDLVGSDQHGFAAVLIENPHTCAIEVGFSAGAGSPKRSSRRVPPLTGLMIARGFEVVSVGVADTSILPAAGIAIDVVRYDAPQEPVSYPVPLLGSGGRTPGQNTIGAAAVEVLAPGVDRRSVALLNNSAGTIAIGQSAAVTVATGWPIPPGGGLILDTSPNAAVWAIGSGPGLDLRYFVED